MKAKATPKFWREYERLPRQMQKRARLAYQKWKENPSHPSLHFKRVDEEEAIYSVRISDDYRALGILRGDTVIWYWIGSHEGYLRLLK
jgi:mRNA-degrading endonuclease RelE of RelBE toxin-antitoxin system